MSEDRNTAELRQHEAEQDRLEEVFATHEEKAREDIYEEMLDTTRRNTAAFKLAQDVLNNEICDLITGAQLLMIVEGAREQKESTLNTLWYEVSACLKRFLDSERGHERDCGPRRGHRHRLHHQHRHAIGGGGGGR